jgi:TrmH family RNA methyltransferase
MVELERPREHSAVGRHSPRLKRLREIVAGAESGLAVLDGVKLAVDAGRAGAAITEVYGTAGTLAELAGERWLDALARRSAVFVLDASVAERIAPTRSSQGILAVVRVSRRAVAAAGVAVFLADVQDPGNVGAIVRSAAAFGAAGVACSPACADPFSPRALRASAGAALQLAIESPADFAAVAARFVAAGGTVATTSGHGGTALPDWRPRPPVLLVLGNEGRGVPEPLAERCTERVTVPIATEIESLNVAVSAGILLHFLKGVVRPPILGSGSEEDS